MGPVDRVTALIVSSHVHKAGVWPGLVGASTEVKAGLFPLYAGYLGKHQELLDHKARCSEGQAKKSSCVALSTGGCSLTSTQCRNDPTESLVWCQNDPFPTIGRDLTIGRGERF